jgi:aminopeptidase N
MKNLKPVFILTVSILLLVFLVRPSCFPQGKTVTYYADPSTDPPELIVKLKHLKADVAFKPEENRVIATTEFSFVPLRYTTDSILFYTPEFTIKDVRFKGSPVSYKMSGNNLVLDTRPLGLRKGEDYKIFISYEAAPKAGAIYFVGWKPEESGKRKEIWAHRPHGWLPYIDARITVDVRITFDAKFKVFSNGERVEVKENPDKTKTWHYSMTKNHPFFSTALVIGDYDYKTSRSANGVPLEYWYYAGQEDRVQPTYRYTEAMMDFLEKETGLNYPYPVYRQAPVIDYMYGAMETTTSTIFGDFMLIDPHAYWQRNYINTNAHEMAHQWFGNYVSHLANKDVWLTESFGTYYAKLFERSVFGEDYYQNSKNEELLLTLNAAKSNNYPVGSSLGGNARIYQKGSLVLGMLQYVMGDKEFRDAVKYYLEHHPYMNTESGEFARAVYEVTGKSYSWFFDEWVFHGGEPFYKVSCTVEDDTTGKRFSRVQVLQIQETGEQVGLFRMPVNIEVHYKGGTSDSRKVWIENKYSEIIIPNPARKPLDFVLFDPGRQIVKKISFERTTGELFAQALRAENMIDRYDALQALRSLAPGRKEDVLLTCYGNEKFFLTKAEIISQLAADTDSRVLAMMNAALDDPDALVRKEVLKDVSPVPPALQAGFEKALNDYSYLNVELALSNLVLSFPGNTDRYLDLTKNMTGWRGMNIRMKWLEIAISSGKKEHLPELISYTGPVFEFETRINAFATLKKLRYADETTLKNAKSASQHWNNKLNSAAKDYLNYFTN